MKPIAIMVITASLGLLSCGPVNNEYKKSPPSIKGENLFPQGDFEGSVSDFSFGGSIYESHYYYISESFRYSGNKGLRLHKASFTISPEKMPVLVPGKNYELRFFSRLIQHQSGEALPALNYYLASTSVPATLEVNAYIWTQQSLRFTHAGAGHSIVFETKIDTQNIVDLDDIRIEEVD